MTTSNLFESSERCKHHLWSSSITIKSEELEFGGQWWFSPPPTSRNQSNGDFIGNFLLYGVTRYKSRGVWPANWFLICINYSITTQRYESRAVFQPCKYAICNLPHFAFCGYLFYLFLFVFPVFTYVCRGSSHVATCFLILRHAHQLLITHTSRF